MGQSFGGTIALEYARTFPEHVRKLILVDGASDFPDAFAHWEAELKTREPATWAAAMATAQGAALKQAESGADPCTLARARFAVVWSTYTHLGPSDFHHWQQFHYQRFEHEQDALDAQSGLRNTGELQAAYFTPGNPFLCYRFTAYDRLTMPVLVIEGRYDGAVDPEQSRALAAHVPSAQYDEFEQSAHFPYAEEPAKFEHDVASFLAAASH